MPFDKVTDLGPTHVYSVFSPATSLKMHVLGKFVTEARPQIENAFLQ
jgi:hypothetical protein